jgi:hypothetical protein
MYPALLPTPLPPEDPPKDPPKDPCQDPCHDARDLTARGSRAVIRLDDQTYFLRITRAGKLILTK